MTPRYGIDAPGLVRAFFLAAAVLLAAATLALTLGEARPWAAWLAALLALPGLYALGMGCLMLTWSLRVKVRGRESILDAVAWTGAEAVLDVGCGRGLMLVGAARRLTTGRATGIDLWAARDQSANAAAAPLANAAAEGVGGYVGVATADMRALPFADGAFDVVTSNWAVHNLSDPADRTGAIAEMARVLRPGGTLLLTDIAHRDAYLADLRRLGLGDARLLPLSAARDRLLGLLSFGSFRPATILVGKRAS